MKGLTQVAQETHWTFAEYFVKPISNLVKIDSTEILLKTVKNAEIISHNFFAKMFY